MSHSSYIGGELELFEKATNWKSYWFGFVSAYVRGDVLEVGAGIGANTQLLSGGEFGHWVCVEPDASLLAQIPKRVRSHERHVFVVGTLLDLDPEWQFDTVLYIDVMEHIPDDGDELRRAAARLKTDGTLIILSPAHQWLFSPFDEAIGHYRRYTKKSLTSEMPEVLRLERLMYLDCAGLFASLMNRIVLNRSMPTERQILTWDRLLVPISVRFDAIFGYRIGKSVLGIWRRQASD